MSALGQKQTSQCVCAMSALGQKRTSRHLQPMSALPPKADLARACRDVCFVPKADIRFFGLLADTKPPVSQNTSFCGYALLHHEPGLLLFRRTRGQREARPAEN